jgi:hypothetical protein
VAADDSPIQQEHRDIETMTALEGRVAVDVDHLNGR